MGFIDRIRYAYYVTYVNVRESTRFGWFKLSMKLWLSLTIIINYIIQWYKFSLICLTKQEKKFNVCWSLFDSDGCHFQY